MASFPTRVPADPFLSHAAMPFVATWPVLDVPVRFESNRRWLLNLAEAAYGSLEPVPKTQPHQLRVRLLANDDDRRMLETAPEPNVYSDGQVVSAIFGPADAVMCAPALGSALITVSRAMRRFPYHVRYEMIEFACYRLASHALQAVGLHAASVADGERSWLIIGESGAGKSTLTFASLVRGWDLIAEDSAFVLTDVGEVRGVPTFVHLLDDSLSFFGDVRMHSQIITRRSGKAKHEINVGKTFLRPLRSRAPLGGLVFLEPRRNAPSPRLRRLTESQARSRLIHSQPFAPNYAGWEQTLALLSTRPAVALAAGTDVWQAVDALGSASITGFPSEVP